MSLCAWCSQGPRDPSSCTTFTLNTHGAELPQLKKKKKKVLHLCIQGHFGHVQLFVTLWPVACQDSLP